MPRVLVVEDDAGLRLLMGDVLHDEGYEVVAAGNGAEALDVVQGPPPPPDLIVTDLMMPVMNGWVFVERCRQDAACASIPIVVISAAHALPQDAVALTAQGVRACLAKPFDIDALVAVVQRYVPVT